MLLLAPTRLQDFDGCLELIDKVLEETCNLCEFGLYVKALIKRQQGAVY